MRADDGYMLVVKAPAPYAPRHLYTARYAVFAYASSLLVECWRQAGGGSYGSLAKKVRGGGVSESHRLPPRSAPRHVGKRRRP